MMNKREQEAWVRTCSMLGSLGINYPECAALRRCSLTLHRWAERECGDGSDWAIERDEATNKPFNVYHGEGKPRRYAIPDRETGALKRAKAIAAAHGLTVYHQNDPRGAALYVIRPGDVPEGADVDGYYSRGIAVY